MKRTTSKRKQLKLSTETVRQLSTTDLDVVHGAGNYTSACAQQTNRCPTYRTTTTTH